MAQQQLLKMMSSIQTAPAGGGLDIHEEGLVCYVDAGLASSYPGSGLTLTDLSSQGNDHTWDTTAPAHTSGSAGYFDFTGAGTDDTSGGTTGFSTGASSWSIDSWFHVDVATAWDSIWSIGTWSVSAGSQGLHMGVNDAGLLYVKTSAGVEIFGPLLTASTMYSALVTYDGANLEIFLNNSLEATSAQTLNITFGTVMLGFDGDFGDRLDGRLAAWIAYNDELTSDERLTNYTEFTSRY